MTGIIQSEKYQKVLTMIDQFPENVILTATTNHINYAYKELLSEEDQDAETSGGFNPNPSPTVF